MNDQADMLIHPTSRLLSLCCGLIAWVLVGEVGAYHPYVIATTPTQNNHTTLTNSNIVGTFSVGMSAATTTTFVVQGSMTGKRAGIYSGGTTTTITFDPTSDFIPGEDVEVIFTGGATTGYTNTVNDPIFSGGHIVRFRTAVGAGPVNFTASRPIGPGTSSATTGLAVADIDGDGDLDVVVGNDGTQNVAYLQTLAAFTTSANYGSGAESTKDLALGDLNGNGKVDVVLAEGASTSLAYRNNGSGTFNAGATSLAAGDVRGVEMGDFNGDGHLDIALGFHSLLNKLVITDGAGAVSRTNLWGVSGTDTRSIAVGDTDNDGDLDVAVGNNTANQNVVYLNDGVGNIAAGTDNFGSGADNTNSVVLGDINADGFLDVGSGNAAQQNAFYLNDGAGNFTGGTINFGTGTDNTLSL
ncbi:MAG: VCBS repeat-containing protein, partial [Candidatus Latescibacterota bacterium]|nr:VCBS repeat-containing protein [Candidatus Latescibacterota bacterium]